MISGSRFRFSIRFWLILLFFVTSVLWGSYAIWDHRCEQAADRFIQLMDWKNNQDYLDLEDATRDLDPEIEKRVARRLQKKFPFVSLTDRLAYESKSEKYVKKSTRSPSSDPNSESQPLLGGREGALKALHEGRVNGFVGSPGFGVMRTVPRSAIFYLAAKESSLVESPKMVELDRRGFNASFGDSIFFPKGSAAEDLLAEEELKTDDAKFVGEQFNRPKWFLDAHRNVTRGFTMTSGAYVRSPDQVAGFKPHEVIYFRWKAQDEDPASDRSYPIRIPDIGSSRLYSKIVGQNYAVLRVDLVSLLVHQKPLVYVSEKLPNMEELSPDVMRELDPFEKAALVKLENGESLVARQKDDTILMLGPIRASGKCLECHSVREGDLLGAFSYVLKVLDE